MDKRKQIIEVVPYDVAWPEQFANEALLIKPIFADNFVTIHHIGSTSIPGMFAKPTIDIILEVNDITQVDKCNQAMKILGYEAWGEYHIKNRRFFVKGEEKRTHHVHTFQIGSDDIARHLYFRDYLKAHPEIAHEYANLKIKLAEKYPNNRRAYVLKKEEYVKALERKAIAWFQEQR